MSSIFSNQGYQSLSNEDKKDFILNKIYKYSAKFLDVTSSVLRTIYKSLSNSFVNLYDVIYNLKNADWTEKGLRLRADEYRIFYKSTATEQELQNFLINRYNILSKRGTGEGITNDLMNIDYNITPNIQFQNEGGWVIDQTYPEVDNSFIDVNKLIKLNFSYIGAFGSAIFGVTRFGDNYFLYVKNFVESIRKYVVPAHVTIIYE